LLLRSAECKPDAGMICLKFFH